ncbi:helix-turn-helix transcriptional regulator [bacterium]|nr:helix-turn-helix transcriptional regulator [bacterium]
MDIRTPILHVFRKRALSGYEIVRLLRDTAPKILAAGEGMIYPALRRLEHQKLVRAEWRLSAKGKKRRYYSLTPKGRRCGGLAD